jgi:hypothetical protein
MVYFRASTRWGSARLFALAFGQRIARAATARVVVFEEPALKRSSISRSAVSLAIEREISTMTARGVLCVIKRIELQRSRLNRCKL